MLILSLLDNNKFILVIILIFSQEFQEVFFLKQDKSIDKRV